jgi:hypothetical protein
MPHDAWMATSLEIRLEHECAHYMTKRLFGTMRNALHDELIADRAGMVAACGRYRADWARRFFGVEGGDEAGVRPGGRLHTYRGTPPLSDAAFGVLARLAVRAIDSIDRFEQSRPKAIDARRDALAVLVALARTPVELLATRDAVARLHRAHESARAAIRTATADSGTSLGTQLGSSLGTTDAMFRGTGYGSVPPLAAAPATTFASLFTGARS